MRTTIDIDDDILLAAKEIARTRRISVGKVVSELARKGFNKPVRFATRNGFPVLPKKKGGRPVTLELVNRLRESDVEEYIHEYRRMVGRATRIRRKRPD